MQKNGELRGGKSRIRSPKREKKVKKWKKEWEEAGQNKR